MAGSKKKKNAFTLLALFGTVCLMIAAYLLLLQHKKEAAANKAAEESAKANKTISLADFDTTQIKELHVQNNSYDYTLIPQKEVWVLKGEEAFPMDQEVAGDLVDGIAKLSAKQEVEEASTDLSEYGLANPQIKVTAEKKDGTNIILNIGDKLTTDSYYYASLEGDPKVYVILTSLRNTYAKGRDDLMEVEDTPSITTDQLKGIKVESDQYDNFTLLYDEKNPYDFSGTALYPWYLKDTYKENLSADTNSVSTLLGNYTSFAFNKAIDYKKENLDSYGLLKPKHAVTLWYTEKEDDTENKDKTENRDKTEKEFTLYIGNQDEAGNYYVKMGDSDRTYLMTSSNVEKLLKVDVFSLVSKMTNLVGITTIDGFKVKIGSEEYSYKVEHVKETGTDGTEKTSEVFYVGETKYEDEEGFRQYYQKLIGLTADNILPEDAKVSDTPVLSIVFDKIEEDKNFIVEYFPYNEESYAVRINGTMIFSIKKDQVDSIMETIRGFGK